MGGGGGTHPTRSAGTASPAAVAGALGFARRACRTLGDGRFEPEDPSTWGHVPRDRDGVALASRGFLELYHDASLAELRQQVRAYLHHVLLWGTPDLWTSLDRLGLKPPGHAESAGLPLHVDQSALIHPQFRTTQGVLALVDCPVELGTLVAVPGSRARFADYGRLAGRGDYVELAQGDPLHAELSPRAQAIPIRAGDLVTWDSRTTHANSPNLTPDRTRWVAYLSAGPARVQEATAAAARREAFRSGIGSNLRDALMHASRKPRWSDPDGAAAVREPERLTALGRMLHGFDAGG